MDAKLAWLLEKYYYRSQESVGCSSSQADLYLAKKELHQLHLDEEALIETKNPGIGRFEKAMDQKTREKKIRQKKQDDDDEFFLEFGVVRYDSEYESSDYARVEPSPFTPNPVRVIPGPAGVVQFSSSTRVEPSPLTINQVRIIPGHAVMSTQEYMQKVVEDDNFKSTPWMSATEYVNANGGTVSGCLGDIYNNMKKMKLDQVVAIFKSYSPNMLGDLTVTMKDLSCTIP
nr:hypothetical protein [Tanacetum cinerariifolium]